MEQNQILASPPSNLSNTQNSNSLTNVYIIIFVFIFLSLSICIILSLLYIHRRREENDQNTPDETIIPTPNNSRQNENDQSERSSGLHRSIIERFPILKENEVKELKADKGSVECTVCLSEFEDHDENLRKLPGCCHVFHVECIETWFVSQATCPVCRVDLNEVDALLV